MFASEEKLPEIAIHADDYARLESLINGVGQSGQNAVVEYLERELNRASIIAPGDNSPAVVNMHSTVTFVDPKNGGARTVTLVYPHEADIKENKISILSPIGAALIGMYVGEQIAWHAPGGQRRVVKVLRIKR